MLAQLEPSYQREEFWIGVNDRRWKRGMERGREILEWIGDGEEGHWQNFDDTPFDYTHWADGEPNGSEEVGKYSK